MSYRLELVNAYTQEVLREVEYKEPDHILGMIESAENTVGKDLEGYIIDNQQRTLIAEYVTYSLVHEANKSVYKLFFKVKLSEKQAKIR